MSVPERTPTPIQAACDNLIAALREQARPIDEAISTLSRIRGLPFEHGDPVFVRDAASQLHNVSVDLRGKLRKALFHELAKGFLELERNLIHALEGGRK